MDAVSAAALFASSLEASRSGCTELWAITSTVSDGCALWKAFLVDLESVWQTLARTTRATWTLPGTSGVPSPAATSGGRTAYTARRPPPRPWGHSSPRATTSTIVILSRFVALSVSPILKSMLLQRRRCACDRAVEDVPILLRGLWADALGRAVAERLQRLRE